MPFASSLIALPWRDRAGRFSPLKAAVFAATLIPAVLLAIALLRAFGPAAAPGLGQGVIGGPGIGGPGIGDPGIGCPALPSPLPPAGGAGIGGPALGNSALGGPLESPFGLGARPYTEAIHVAGDWAIRFLLAALAVTPLARFARRPKLVGLRRMLGLAALFYALAHLGLYVADQSFSLSRVAGEIASRVYLAVGFVALLGLCALGVTSTDAAIRRMGRAWRRLHALVHPITALALLHYFMQVKVDVTTPALHAGLYLFLVGLRLAVRLRFSPGILVTLVVAVLAAPATAAVEAVWYAAATAVDPARVLEANLMLDPVLGLRPAQATFACGVAFAGLAAALSWRGTAGRPASRDAGSGRRA